ncbi:terminase small subunit [Pseudomonas fuscovaginae UPB0736]|uniref:terminase small subunit n=1 Tax=Pseudomonas asplenii TaxID=53407 RepID=UPI0002885D01|nr:terminase small subunit [Pseudomonas fuscovaginae]UUQ64232.1 terminase small subunit [Pseudomonas fuscovaginae UPB0736]
MGKTVSKLELGEIIGRDERTLSRWQKDGMPVNEFGLGRGNENQYDTQAVIEWLMRQAALNGKKESTRDRLDRLRGDREELALAKDLGEVVVEAEMVERFEAVITAAKIELLNTFPDERTRIKGINALASKGFEKEIEAAIDDGSSVEATALVLFKAAQDRGISLSAIKSDAQGVAGTTPNADGKAGERKAAVSSIVAGATSKRR